MRSRHVLAVLLAPFALACGGAATPDATEEAVVNVYSHRHYDIDKQLFARFTEETGIAVNVVTAGADELITRLEAEGTASPADLLITVDAGRLHRAVSMGLLQGIQNDSLEGAVPVEWRDP
jgi:iron(III) transport system substrate-binding protein